LLAEIPEEWLRKLAEKHLTEEEKKQVQALGGLEKILEELKKAAGGTEGPSPGRQQVGGNRRHITLWRIWLQSGGRRIGQDKNRNNVR
jgi:uncharacterized protein